ncbi:hypothetical protein CEQ90_04590 [Lewinellaceae bacterium SD302]|nr:hypothetical protein CEQ90_04590 [Lewinellaceae bacterium SD302]
MQQEQPPQKEKTEPTKSYWDRINLDRSDIIAMIALAVSLIGTLVAVRETSILQQQQEVAMAQKSASVLPYMSTNLNLSYKNDSLLTVTFSMANDGIGPAFLADLQLYYDSVAVDADELADQVHSLHPELRIFNRQSNMMTDGVIPAGKEILIFELTVDISNIPLALLDEIGDKFMVTMCYCNVYGDCWKYQDNDWAIPTESCGEEVRKLVQ